MTTTHESVSGCAPPPEPRRHALLLRSYPAPSRAGTSLARSSTVTFSYPCSSRCTAVESPNTPAPTTTIGLSAGRSGAGFSFVLMPLAVHTVSAGKLDKECEGARLRAASA